MRHFHQLNGRGCYEGVFGLLPHFLFVVLDFSIVEPFTPALMLASSRDRETVDSLQGYSAICI